MTESIYPKLETVKEVPMKLDQDYRLREISEIKTKLLNEVEQRRKYRKTKKILFNTLEGMCIGLNTITAVLGIGGIALLSTVIAAPLCIALEGIALGAGGLSVFLSLVNNRSVVRKLEKHDKIYAVAISKLNTISDLILNALEDGKVDPIEFKLITDEYEKYHILKNQIRKQTLDESKQNKIYIEV
jgi:DNA-binding Xre family transcriptional regulator